MDIYNEITAKPLLVNLKNWHFNAGGIEKNFLFKNFTLALGFIVKVGVLYICARIVGMHVGLVVVLCL